MSGYQLPNHLYDVLFKCVMQCDDALDVYLKYIDLAKYSENHNEPIAHLRDEADYAAADFAVAIPECWRTVIGLTSIEEPPSPPPNSDSIDEKAHRVRRLRSWAVKLLPSTVSASEVVDEIQLFLKATDDVEESFKRIRPFCKAAEIRYLNSEKECPVKHELIARLHRIFRISTVWFPNFQGRCHQEPEYRNFIEFVHSIDLDALEGEDAGSDQLKNQPATSVKTDPESESIPHWNNEDFILSFKDKSCNPFAKRAKTLAKVLIAFEEAGWTRSIDSPFPDNNRDALHDIRKRLEERKFPLTINAGGDGETIIWEPIER